MSLAYGKEPLLPWLGALFMTLGFEPLTSVRLVSTVAGLVTLVCTALIARELGGRPAAAAAAAICVVLPFFVVHDVIGIYDPLAAATAAAALLLLIRLARQPDVLTTIGLGLALGAGLLTKQTTYVSLALLPLGALLVARADTGWAGRLLAWGLRVVVAVMIAVALYSVLLLSEHYESLARVRELLYPSHSLSEGLARPGYWLERNWPQFRSPLASYLTAPIVLVAVVGTALGLRLQTRLAAVVLAWSLAPIAAAVLLANEDAPYPRYLLTGIPPIVALAGYGCAVGAAAVRARLERRVAVVALSLLAAAGVAPAVAFDATVIADPATARYPGADDVQYATGWPAGAPWRRVAADLRRLGGGPASVVVADPYSDTLKVLLGSEAEFRVVRYLEGDTLYGVTNGRPLPRDDIAGTWRELGRYERPRGGVPLVLYQRGIEVLGAFVTSPEMLRRRLALSDPEFDRFLARRPDVREWYLAWYSARE